MKYKIAYILVILILPVISLSQAITNVHFEQVGKKIHIYYDLQGDQEFTIQVFCSTDNGQTWGKPMQKVTGSVGEGQKPGNVKMIVWDVLTEREKLSGEIRFKIEAFPGNTSFFTDIRDGQTYKWVKIGLQVWMAENLNFKTKSGSWVYDRKRKNAATYGRLYDWSTARSVCPEGWHLPSDREWKLLEDFLRKAESEAALRGWPSYETGTLLKSTGGWLSDGNGNDATGFSALPGGQRNPDGDFNRKGLLAGWWSATEYSPTLAWYRYLLTNYNNVARSYSSKDGGYGVRCVRD